jgi:trk system potassium uptake protein TrkH
MSEDLKIVLRDIGNLLLVLSVLVSFTLIVPIIFNEPEEIIPFLLLAIISAIAGISLKYACKTRAELELKHAMVIAALAWLVIPLFSIIPFLANGYSPIDSYFETMSGWTGTGLTMIQNISQSSHAIQFWRSFMEWIGGVGVVILLIAIISRPGTGMYFLYKSEGREDKMLPRIMTYVRWIWETYLVLTLGGIALLLLLGMPLWDSINNVMTAIATGGFSIKDNGIQDYNNPLFESGLVVVMLAGAVPFLVIYKMSHGKWRSFFEDIQVRMLFYVVITGVAALSIENYYSYYGAWLESFRQSSFQFISGLTTTGHQSAGIHKWSESAHLILAAGMILGGAAGSTAGGIKLIRGALLYYGIGWWFRKIALPSRAVFSTKIGDKVFSEEEMSMQLREAALIIALWLIFLFTGIIVMLHVVPPAYNLSDVIVEVASAQSNVGLTTGITSHDMSGIGKVMLMLNMWIGRLEIIPNIIFIRLLFSGFNPFALLIRR